MATPNLTIVRLGLPIREGNVRNVVVAALAAFFVASVATPVSVEAKPAKYYVGKGHCKYGYAWRGGYCYWRGKTL